MILYPAELGFSSFSSSIKHIPKNWMNAYCPRKNRKRLIYPRDRYQLCGRGTLLLLSETCACIIYKTIKNVKKEKGQEKKGNIPGLLVESLTCATLCSEVMPRLCPEVSLLFRH